MTSKLPVVAGILQIAVAFTIFFFNMGFFAVFIGDARFGGSDYDIVLGLFGLLTFVSGLAGGLLAIMREHFYITVLGGLLSLCWGLLVRTRTLTTNVIIVTMTILLPILILVFLLASRKEFS